MAPEPSKFSTALYNFEAYLDVEKNLSPRTRKAYVYDLERFADFLIGHGGASKNLAQITTDDIRRYLEHHRMDLGHKSTTLARTIASIRIFFEYCVVRQLIDQSPAAFLHNPKLSRKLPIFLIQSELRNLLDAPANNESTPPVLDSISQQKGHARSLKSETKVDGATKAANKAAVVADRAEAQAAADRADWAEKTAEAQTDGATDRVAKAARKRALKDAKLAAQRAEKDAKRARRRADMAAVRAEKVQTKSAAQAERIQAKALQGVEASKAKRAARAPRDYAILATFAFTGVRLSELTEMSLGDLDLESRTVRVLGKGSKERILPLNDTVIRALESWLAIRKPADPSDPAVFLNHRGTRISPRGIELLVDGYVRAAGISKKGVSPHKLRHTFATLLHVHGTDILEIQALLGHSSVTSTQIYTHTSSPKLKAAVKNLETI